MGTWLDPQTPGVERFDLLEAVCERAVVYFSLESDRRPLLTQMLGAAIVQDLQTTVAALQGRPVPTLVVIDEFSAIAAAQVVRLFGRARSAGFSLLLCTQELSDLRLPGRERLLEQVMGNLSVLIAHRQVVPESAGLIASLAGRRGAWRSSRHSDGRVDSHPRARGRARPDRDRGARHGLGCGDRAERGRRRALRSHSLRRRTALSRIDQGGPMSGPRHSNEWRTDAHIRTEPAARAGGDHRMDGAHGRDHSRGPGAPPQHLPGIGARAAVGSQSAPGCSHVSAH